MRYLGREVSVEWGTLGGEPELHTLHSSEEPPHLVCQQKSSREPEYLPHAGNNKVVPLPSTAGVVSETQTKTEESHNI